MARLDRHAVSGERHIFASHQVRAADMQLITGGNINAPPRRAHRTEALTLGSAFLTEIVRAFAAADGEANPARAHQAGFFLFLKAPGGVAVRRRHDIDVVARLKLHVAVARHGGSVHQQVIARNDLHVIATQQ